MIDGVDFQHTGEVRGVDTKAIDRLLDDGSVVLLSPLGYSPTGEAFNLACEDVAVQAAVELRADKLILYGGMPGVLDSNGHLIREIRPHHAGSYLAKHRDDPGRQLLAAAADACSKGVPRSYIISYEEDGALLT